MQSDYKIYEGANSAPLHAAGAVTTGKAIAVADWGNIIACVATSGNTTATVSFKVSISDVAPDFSAAATRTNKWTVVQVKNRDTDNATNGATGVAFTGTDGVFTFSVNGNRFKWFCPCVTAWTQGLIDVDVLVSNNV